MLFPYIYVNHKIEKMQSFIKFIFDEIWCKAPHSGPFGLHLFSANAELHEVMESFLYSDAQGADFFYSHVESIYGQFSHLTHPEISQFQRWYEGNNAIESVCANDPAIHLVRYSDLVKTHKDLSDKLGTFFGGVYSPTLLGLAALRDKIGEIDDHYLMFMQANKVGKCPFCGINDLLGEYHSRREAYDHYLPKALYPFNSINFHNLVPCCHHCNSSYKTSKDPAYAPKDPTRAIHRRVVFYPFKRTPHSIDLHITLRHADIENLSPTDISLQFGPITIAQEIDTWKDVYNIEERYRAKLCGENDGKYWLTQVLDEWHEDGKSPSDFLTTLSRQAQSHPYAECNFLKVAFLEACGQQGIFDTAVSN